MKLLTLISITLAISLSAFSANSKTTIENHSLVKAGDKFLTLIGEQINIGEAAPNFKVVNESFSPITLDSFSGKNILISVVPSIDTGVCSNQTKLFNNKVIEFSENTVFMTISSDLPFAQKRFCDIENIQSMQLLSDSVWKDFGTKYGVLIKDMGLLTRAIFIINTEQQVVYKELVANISDYPNYEEAINQLNILNKKQTNK